jgi:hypothetical protein
LFKRREMDAEVAYKEGNAMSLNIRGVISMDLF